MKSTRRILLLLLLISGAFCHAQSFHLKAGVALTKMKIANNNGLISEDYLYRIGGCHGLDFRVAEFEMGSLWTGLTYASKGYRRFTDVHFNGTQNVYRAISLNLRYLEIPIFARIDKTINETTFFGLFGVYNGLSIFGKFTYKEYTEGGTFIKEKVVEVAFGDDPYDFRLLNLGALIGAGFEFRTFMFECAYDFGISQVDNLTANDLSYRNRGFRFSIGSTF
jgi:hypothetical protein